MLLNDQALTVHLAIHVGESDHQLCFRAVLARELQALSCWLYARGPTVVMSRSAIESLIAPVRLAKKACQTLSPAQATAVPGYRAGVEVSELSTANSLATGCPSALRYHQIRVLISLYLYPDPRSMTWRI